MEHFDWIETIKLNILMLKSVGLWPKGEGSYKPNCYFFYKITCIVLLQFGYIFFQTVNLYFIKNDLEAVTGTVFVLIPEFLVVFKSYLLMKNMRVLKQLMVTLNSDSFQPKTAHQRELIRANLRSWKLVTHTLWTIVALWYFFWGLFPVLSGEERRLPTLAWYPFDVDRFPQYQLTYLHQLAAMMYICGIHLGADALVAGLNMYIGAQFDILSDDLRRLGRDSEDVNESLVKCVQHHREILKFASHANCFYNRLLLGAFFAGGLSIGLALFQLTVVVPFSSEFYSYTFYSSGFVLQGFQYCWFGNEIEVKSGKLLYALFEANWTDLAPEVRKNLIIFSLRLQKPLRIFAMDLFSLSLDTYMRILKTAYTYFTLLRNANTLE